MSRLSGSATATSGSIRVGAVSYLNTVPLVDGLTEISGISLSFDLPSRLADNLSAGHLDVALIPCVEFFQNPDYVVVSDACIACRGPVLSVKLLSRRPFEEMESLALDEGSRTSAALVRILLRQRFGISPQLRSLPLGEPYEQADADAVLIIGDRAMHPAAGFPHQWDLGAEWCEWSGLPFVFAMWVARRGIDTCVVERELSAARDRGVGRLETLAKEHADSVGLSEADCLAYLRDNLYFYLGDKELQGMRRFRDLAHEFGLAPPPEEPPWIPAACAFGDSEDTRNFNHA